MSRPATVTREDIAEIYDVLAAKKFNENAHLPVPENVNLLFADMEKGDEYLKSAALYRATERLARPMGHRVA